jgi:hypothetical protein
VFNTTRYAGSIGFSDGRTKEARLEETQSLNKAAAYRRHARACHALARHAQNEDQRLQLLAMAEIWESLAIEQETMRSDDQVKSPSPAAMPCRCCFSVPV